MACIATLVWMRVKADHDLAALREGPAGHSSGAVAPSLTSAAVDFLNACSFFLPTSTDGPLRCCMGRFFVCAEPPRRLFPVLLFKIPRSSKSNSVFRCAGSF